MNTTMISIEDLSAFYKEQLPGNSLLYTAVDLSSYLASLDDKFALSADVSSKTELHDKFLELRDKLLAISNHLPANLTETASANTFLYSPSNEVSDICWKEYIPEPSAALSSYYLQITDASGTLAWTKVKALPDESAETKGLVLTSHGLEDPVSWEAYSAISRTVGDIFYTTRIDVLDDNGKMLNGAVPCNGKTWTNMPETLSGVIDLLGKGVLPYVSMAEYATILTTQNGICHVFGWDGEDDVRVPMLNDVFIESSISADNIAGFAVSSDISGNIVYDEDGNMISCFNGYLEAGIPNITGVFSGVGQEFGSPSSSGAALSGAIYRVNTVDEPEGGVRVSNISESEIDDIFGFSAISGETNVDGTLKTADEYHVYGNSDTVQPRAVRYIPMVQLYNSVNEAAVVKYDDIMNSIQAGHMLGEVFYTTRLDTIDSNTSAHMINGAVACNGQIRYCSVNISAENEFDTTEDITDYDKYLSNTIPGLLKLGKLPYVTLDDYADIISAYGVCRCFGWDGNKETEINSDVFRKYRVPKLDKVFIEAGLNASDVSGGQYIEAGIPNITGFVGTESVIQTPSGSFYAVNTGDDGGILSPGENPDGLGFSALSGETNVNGELKSEDEYHVYGNSNTVQPPAVCYVPMVQIVNKVEASMINEYSDLQNKLLDLSSYVYSSGQLTEITALTLSATEEQPTSELSTTIIGPCYIYGTTSIETSVGWDLSDMTIPPNVKVEVFIDNILVQTVMSHHATSVTSDDQIRYYLLTNNACSIFIPFNKEATIKTSSYCATGTAKVYKM